MDHEFNKEQARTIAKTLEYLRYSPYRRKFKKPKYNTAPHQRLKVLGKQHREKKPLLSKKGLAKLLGISPQVYYSYESGTVPPAHMLIALARFYNVSVDYLLGLTPIRNPDYNAISKQLLDAGIDAEFVDVIKTLYKADPNFVKVLILLAQYQAAAPSQYHLLRLLQMFLFNPFSSGEDIIVTEEGDMFPVKDYTSSEYLGEISRLPADKFIKKALLQSIEEELIQLRETCQHIIKKRLPLLQPKKSQPLSRKKSQKTLDDKIQELLKKQRSRQKPGRPKKM